MVASTEATAIKGFNRREKYLNERNAYLRLRQCKLTQVGPFRIPTLIRFDDDLEIIEMTIVQPPFLLDFASAYIDCKPPYSYEELELWHEGKEEDFGKDRWEVVTEAISILKGRAKIWLADVHAGNVRFENDTTE